MKRLKKCLVKQTNKSFEHRFNKFHMLRLRFGHFIATLINEMEQNVENEFPWNLMYKSSIQNKYS